MFKVILKLLGASEEDDTPMCKDAFPQEKHDKKGSEVSHPSHYNTGKIEVIEAIEDWGLNFHRGNAVKYTARAGKKDQGKEIQDLQKAVWYLNREIEVLQSAKDGRESVRPNDMVKR